MPRFRRTRDPTIGARTAGRGFLPLEAGERVAVVGAGPAGTFFAHTLLGIANGLGVSLDVELHDPRDFTHPGPGGCAHCGGIVSESLVQILAAEGIRLPAEVIRRGIGAYVVHMDIGQVRIESERGEERIASLYRGPGPRGSDPGAGVGLDDFLLRQALERGATLKSRMVTSIQRGTEGLGFLTHPDGNQSGPYHLVAVASGVNSKLVGLLPGRRPPRVARTWICEFRATEAEVERLLGDAMHVFLLDLPNLEFAALIPKGDHISLCMLGDRIDAALIDAFLAEPEVRRCLPEGAPTPVCHCAPLINVRAREAPYRDRFVLLGDAGITRLYKDGIGAAFRTAKAAAETAVLFGVAAEDFRRHYAPICRSIESDNRIGRAIFGSTWVFKKLRPARRAVLQMTRHEQAQVRATRRMSRTLWNLFTGSAPYRTILKEAMHPSVPLGLLRALASREPPATREERRDHAHHPGTPVS